jgi:hypothetical protein
MGKNKIFLYKKDDINFLTWEVYCYDFWKLLIWDKKFKNIYNLLFIKLIFFFKVNLIYYIKLFLLYKTKNG